MITNRAMRLVYSREHRCHNMAMIWQPASRSWYCIVCSRREGPNDYGVTPQPVQPTSPATDMHDQPEPEMA